MGILPPDVRPVVPHMTPSRGWATWGVHVVLLAAAFALADALSALTSGPGSGVAGIWIPGGIGLAGLLLGGLGLWPALVVGGLAAAPAYGALGAATVPIVLANTVAVLVAAWAIGRARTDLRLGRLGDVARFGMGCLVGGVPMGLLGVATLLALGGTEEGPTGSVVALWVLSTVTGLVVVGGALTVLVRRWRDPVPGVRRLEVAVGLLAAAGLSAAVFLQEWGGLTLVLLLVTALVAGRGGPRGAALASLVVFGFAAASVVGGGGPFGGDDLITRSLSYQTAVLVMAVGLQAIGALGSGERGAVPDTPTPGLVVGLLVGGGVALGLSEAIVTPEVILLVPKAQVTLVGALVALVVVAGALVGTGLRGHLTALRGAAIGWWATALLAGVALFGAEELFLMSLTYTDVTRAIVLASIAPVMLVIVGIARQVIPLSGAVIGGLALVLVGFYSISPGEGWFTGLGDTGLWLGIGSSACTAILLLALVACRRQVGAGPTLAVTLAAAAVSAAVLCAALGVLPGPALWGNEQALGGIVYVGIVGTLVPVLVATWAVVLLGATRVAMFEVLVPPIAVVAAIAWGETTMGALQFAGILMLLAGVALGTRVHLSAHAH
jgi:drug/metabolite transporter (DMT)-like permease/integral membrane sensor domain MASE1